MAKQGKRIAQETVDRIFELDRKGINRTTVARILGVSRVSVYQVLRTRVESVRSAKENPSSNHPKNRQKTPARRVILSEKDIPHLPRQLHKYVQNCKKFEFLRTENGVD